MTVQIIPKVAWLTVNRNCNFRCAWCYAKGTSYNLKDEMSLDLAKKLTLLLVGIGVKRLILIGGEPSLWKHLIEFNCFCEELSIKTVLATNAMRFGADTFWKEYQKHPNDSVGISLKAHSPQALRTIARVTDFGKVRLGIKRGTDFFKCGVSIVYNTLNVNNLIDTVSFAMDCGVYSASIGFCTPIINKTEVNADFMITPSVLVSNIVRDYWKLSKITGKRLSFSMKLPLCLWPEDFIDMLIEKKQITTVCQLQRKTGVIFSGKGNLTLCNSLFDYPLAKYGKEFTSGKEFLTFLNSQKIIDIYDKINTYPSEKCIGCKMFAYCGGGCVLLWTVYNAKQVIKGFK